MARIGLKYPVATLITQETWGNAPTYGTGFVIGKAIAAEKSIESNDNPLYGDDSIAENDTSFSKGSIKLGVTEFGTDRISSLEIQAKLLGHEIVTESGVKVLRRAGGTASPNIGFGYYKTKKHNGSRYYEATWLYKVQFKTPSESTNTKGESIEWQTPEIEGTIMKVEGFNDDAYEDTATFATEAEAKAWLNSKANIETTINKATLATNIATAEAKQPETYTSASYADMYVALLNAKAVNGNAYAGQAEIDSASTALSTAISALEERS